MKPSKATYSQVFESNRKNIFLSLNNIDYLHSQNDIFLFSGEETVHVKCKINAKQFVLVCFTDQNKNAKKRYKSLVKILENYNLSFIPNIEFKKNEISINTETSSVVLVEDDQTISLATYFDNISFLPELVTKLQNDLKDLASQLKAKQFAHGNLTFNSIRVKSNNDLVLTCLDDLYVPEFETNKINKDTFVNLHNKDLAAFAMILSALEVAKTDNSIKSNNLIFSFNSQDLNEIENSVAYSLIKSYENQIANDYLEYEALVEQEKTKNKPKNNYGYDDDFEEFIQNLSIDDQLDEDVQKVVIKSSPNGSTVRDSEYEAIGKTPYTLEIKEKDNPYQIIITEKSNIEKVDVFYGMEDVFVDFNETEAAPEDKEQEHQTVSEVKSTTQRKVFFWYVAILFLLMIFIILYGNNVLDYNDQSVTVESEEILFDNESEAAVLDYEQIPYDDESEAAVLDNEESSPYIYDLETNSDEANNDDSSAYYYDGY